MQKILDYRLIVCFLLLQAVLTGSVYAQNKAAAEYLCEMGVAFYSQGRYEDALSEFRKALLVDPANQKAKKYIDEIFLKENTPPLDEIPPSESLSRQYEGEIVRSRAQERISRDELIARTLDNFGVEPALPHKDKKYKEVGDKEGGIKIGIARISGQAQLSMGFTSHGAIWKRANFDLNEKFKSWRMTSDAAFNRRFNTYDPAIYDSLSLNMDTGEEQGLKFHTNLTVDPWSFTGKSNKVTVTGSNGDTAELEMYYWSNSGYVVNHTIYTSLKGDTLGIPELKVENGMTDPFTATSYRNSATFNIPSMKIERQFQPVRELWFDYANDDGDLKLRAFPMGYQDQAYTSDDPLGITNHNIWWKDSMWLRRYTPGNYNSQDTSPSFTKGRWDDSLSFISKDSTGKYLTALRGFSFNLLPQETTSFDATIATPKDLWQDYGNVDNVIAAARVKHYFADNFMAAGTFSSRLGFITESKHKLDSQNFVGGVDLGYEVAEGLKAQAEVLTSSSNYDMDSSDYKTETRGNAYYFSFLTRYPQKSIMDLRYGYDDIAMDKEEDFLIKSKFYGSRMDKGFDSAVSDFHDTRKDVWWSRHIHFRKPLDYYSQGPEGSGTRWDELNATRIGDGIDIGRSVLGFRFETLLRDKFSNLFDVRNVHDAEGKFIENVARDEATLKLTDKLTTKFLGIYQKMPKTLGGKDPFVYDGNTGEFFENSAVQDGEDPTIKTGSVGLNYDLFDWLSLNGIYERTNDYTLAYEDFPRNVLRNDTNLSGTYYQDGKLYRYLDPYLYSQGVFPQAPYSFYNVFKCGLRITPLEDLEIYLDYTRNEFEAASLNSDSMNHVGLEVGYMPTTKMGMVFKYIYSRCQDLDRLQAGVTKPSGHHNFSSEFRYMPSKDDEFILQYGVGDPYSISNISSLDPYGGSMLTLDMQHIIRAYYRKKF